ncbi:hypothetical protein MYAM1_001175 [Malassezia yamatoensis]|uniref:Major facilitator superfamily (MFS) profile domain-containing protein n=1 Tax=Malassezia yamatoensis TaxID=253288 RepID=A0AAJ5YQ07_9BASI|nr:hypothetical protein MYAM1_001175 [Malassezia yamatoensis]
MQDGEVMQTEGHASPIHDESKKKNLSFQDLDYEYNTQNWPLYKKISANAVFSLITLVNTYASGVYSPGINDMLQDLHVSKEVAQLGTSLFMFGLGAGSLLWGPLSQSLGRRPVFIMSLASGTLFNLGVCLSSTVTSLMICRALAGFTASATFCNVAGSIVDMTTERNRIPFNTFFRFCTFTGPCLGALFGSIAVHDSDWRWNLRSIPIAMFSVLMVYAIAIPETFAPALERKRERQLMQHSGNLSPGTKYVLARYLPSKTTFQLVTAQVKQSLYVPWILLFEEPLVIIVCFYTSLLYGLLYGSLQFFPKVWQDIRNFTSVQVGYTYAAVILGFLISAILVGCTIQNFAYRRAYDLGTNTPELRLRSGEWSIVFVPVGLFIFAWTAPIQHVHWSGGCIGIFLFSFGMLSVFNAWLAYLTDTYSNNTAAVIGINTFCRSMIAGAFPLFTSQMIDAMTFQGAMSMFAGISVPLTCIGLLFGIYGHRLRMHSKHAVHG